MANRAGLMERVALKASHWSGTSGAFIAAVTIVVVWAVLGPAFGYSQTWQLVINTGTTIITFWMVFLIQRAQNKESRAIELKLNEIVAALKGASNRLVDVEDLCEAEVEILYQKYRKLAEQAKNEPDRGISHSIEEEEGEAPIER